MALSDAIKPPLNSLQQIAQIPKLIQVKREIASLDENKNFEQSQADFGRLFEGLLKLSRKVPETSRLDIVNQVVAGYIRLKQFDEAVAIIRESIQSFDDVEVRKKLVKNAGEVFLYAAADYSDFEDREQYELHISSLCACLNATPRQQQAYLMLLKFIEYNQ